MKQDAVNQDPVTVKNIHWPQAMPAVWLLQSLRLAFGVQTMLPVALGVMLLMLINFCATHLTSASPHASGSISSERTSSQATTASSLAALSPDSSQRSPEKAPALSSQPLKTPAFDEVYVWHTRQASLRQNFRSLGDLTDLRWLFPPNPGLLSFLRVIIVAWMGVAVTAAAAHSFCRDRRLGAIRAMQVAIRQAPAWGTSTLIAGILLGLLWTAGRLTGWASGSLLSLTGSGGFIATVTWLVTGGLTFLLLLLGIVVIGGWFLSLAAIAIDRCSGADALSRGICYCTAHRTRTMLYVLVVCGLSLGFAVATSVVAVQAAMLAGVFMSAESAMTDSPLVWQSGTPAHTFVTLLCQVILFSSLWSGTGITYLLLRQKEDGVSLWEYDEKPMARSSR